MELIKENIEYEQLLGENAADTVVRNEYLIPDTHPDVSEVLMVDVKPSIIDKEVMQDKIYLEGQIEYTVLYLAKEEENMGVHNINYTDRFTSYVDLRGAEHGMSCETDCYMEHMDYSVINERKLALGGIVKLKTGVFKNYKFQIVKDIERSENVQMLKVPASVDKIAGNNSSDLIVKSHMQVSMDRPQIGVVLKCDVKLHKKEVKVTDQKVYASAFALVEILYRGKDSKEIVYLKDDVFINKALEIDDIQPSVDLFSDFKIGAMEFNIKEDDLGENRIVDVEALVNVDVKALYREELDVIDDIYSTQAPLEALKKNFELNVMQGQNNIETIVKENIEIDNDNAKPISVIMTNGKVILTDKKIVEDKVLVEGIVKVDVLFKADDEEKPISKISEELPFSSTVEISGAKIDMQSFAKASLENIEASVEANTIAVKAIVNVHARANYITHKDFLVEVTHSDNEVPKKKASITIYVVQTGDTLWRIAKKYFTTIDELAKVNDIENLEILKIGQKILIPGRAII